MSINDIVDKIKRGADREQFTIINLLVIVAVGLSAFQLGRLSITNITPANINDIKSNQVNLNNLPYASMINESIKNIEYNYVASKNGKLYYPRGCSGAKRIKIENEVWFTTAIDAEKSGFKPSTSCY